MLYIVVALGFLCIALERRFPARPLPAVPGFVARVVAANTAQLGVVLLAGLTWDHLFRARSLFDLGAQMSPLAGAAITYFASTLVYYLWHRLRHESDFFWRWCHQLHHSPQRIETLTSFYKHPVEFLCNGLLSSALAYGVAGLSVEGAALYTLFCAAAEYFYHMNVRTPRWLGLFIQRPEMHRIHHEAGRHSGNYGDLPLWDALFGTLENPDPARAEGVVCGFTPDREARVLDMLLAVDVHATTPPSHSRRLRTLLRRAPATLLLCLGFSQIAGVALGSEALRGVGALSVAAPLPFVFTQFRGYETFATSYDFEVDTADGARVAGPITPALSAALGGPYNRRNPYGAALSYGPALDRPNERRLVDAVLRHGLCDAGPFARALGLASPVLRADIHVHGQTAIARTEHTLSVECTR